MFGENLFKRTPIFGKRNTPEAVEASNEKEGRSVATILAKHSGFAQEVDDFIGNLAIGGSHAAPGEVEGVNRFYARAAELGISDTELSAYMEKRKAELFE